MDSRVQFRVDEETKRLAQQMAESQGHSLSDACRQLIEQLAEQQRRVLAQDSWLTGQVNQAFARLDAGQAVFVGHSQAQQDMAARKARIKSRSQA